jgi:hypothetical protein
MAGTDFELATIGDMTFSKQRYCGVAGQGRVQIKATHPPMSRATLLAALDLSRAVDEDDALKARDTSQAAAVVEAAQRESVGDQDVKIDRQGNTIRVLYRGKPNRSHLCMLASYLFRHRFDAGPWDFREVDREQETYVAAITQMNDVIETLFVPPKPPTTTGQPLYNGQRSRFFPGLLIALLDTDAVAALDEEMAALGFAALGDLVCDLFPGTAMRGYASLQLDTYGVAMATREGRFGRDFYTVFDDGSSVTTSTIPNQTDLPHQKIFRSSHNVRDFRELYRQHTKAVETRCSQSLAAPRPVDNSLVGLAAAIDEFLARMTS